MDHASKKRRKGVRENETNTRRYTTICVSVRRSVVSLSHRTQTNVVVLGATCFRMDRCRIGRLPEVETLAVHFREQGFVVVAAGVVGDGRTKIYACARGVGVEALFYAELVRRKVIVDFRRGSCQSECL